MAVHSDQDSLKGKVLVERVHQQLTCLKMQIEARVEHLIVSVAKDSHSVAE